MIPVCCGFGIAIMLVIFPLIFIQFGSVSIDREGARPQLPISNRYVSNRSEL